MLVVRVATGYNQVLPNEYTKAYKEQVSTDLESEADMREQLGENNWKGLAPETIERAVEYQLRGCR